MTKLLCSLITLILFGSYYSASAVTINKSEKYETVNDHLWSCIVEIKIEGSIIKGDLQKIKDSIEKASALCPNNIHDDRFIISDFQIALNSGGGNVAEAIDIGRYFRSKLLNIRVNESERCYSSCIFLLAGGVERTVHGHVGIHRPYFASQLDEKSSIKDISDWRASMNADINQYFSEVDVPITLLEIMNSTPPEKMRLLTRIELETFRLVGRDPSYDELVIAKEANNYNLDSATYRRRLLKADSACDKRNFISCKNAIILNISQDEAKKAAKEISDLCYPANDRKSAIECTKNINKKYTK